MHRILSAALASAAVLMAAGAPAAVSAQTTTMAPTPAPVVGPTTAPMKTPAASMAPNTGPSGISPMPPPGVLVLDARALRGHRTPTGYTLTGQAQVTDACQSARFDQFLGNIFPPLYNLDQFRNPKMKGVLCVQHVMWVTAQPKTVTSAAPPRYVSVRTKKGVTRVPIR